MKIAYIPHTGRPCYELDWFSEIPAEEIRIIDTTFKHYPKKPSDRAKYCQVGSQNIFWFGMLTMRALEMSAGILGMATNRVKECIK